MKPVRPGLRTLVSALIVLAAVAFGRGWAPQSPEGRTEDSRPTPTAAVRVPEPASPASAGRTSSSGGLDLASVQGAEHRARIARVVEAMDRTGAPPAGVVQGGRRGGKRGVFQNAEGRLPPHPVGYWVESDVWPKNGPRDAERLIFGRDQEVYWTRDHYETFVRLR